MILNNSISIIDLMPVDKKEYRENYQKVLKSVSEYQKKYFNNELYTFSSSLADKIIELIINKKENLSCVIVEPEKWIIEPRIIKEDSQTVKTILNIFSPPDQIVFYGEEIADQVYCLNLIDTKAGKFICYKLNLSTTSKLWRDFLTNHGKKIASMYVVEYESIRQNLGLYFSTIFDGCLTDLEEIDEIDEIVEKESIEYEEVISVTI